jgi:hypothetical protein
MRSLYLIGGVCLFTTLSACSNTVTNTVVAAQATGQGVVVKPGTPGVALRGAESGQKQKIWSYVEITPDCVQTGEIKLKTTTPPTNGTITIEDGEDFPNFPKENVRSACNVKKVPAKIVYYTSNAGFTGTDLFTIQMISGMGVLRDDRYSVTVR